MYSTGNQVPSSALEDMADNAQTFDALVTKTEGTTTDRNGITRRVFQQIIMDMGFQPLEGSFQTGATITARNQCLQDTSTGTFYSWSGVISEGGYVVPAGSTPTTSGGIGPLLWVDRTDLMLRSDINIIQRRFNSVSNMVSDASLSIGQIVSTYGYYDGELSVLRKPLSGNTYIIVAGGTGTADGGAFINLSNGLQAKGLFLEGVNVCQFGAVGAFGNTTDSTLFFQRAMNFVSESTSSNSNDAPTCKGGRVFIPSGYYIIGNLTWRPYVNLQGEHSSTVFLHPLTGATGYMFKNTLDTDLPRAIEISGFTISPTRNTALEEPSKPSISAFAMYSFQRQCLVRDVKVGNIDGIGFDLQGAQDIEFENVEVIWVTKPLNLYYHTIGGSSDYNWTNAVKFVACRFEKSGTSTLTRNRSTHFIACKFEEALLDINDPIGLDFIGCDWAVTTDYAVQVGGTGNNRGMRIIGGSVDTGLPVGEGDNTANFIQANYNVHLIGVSLNGMSSGAILGDVTITDCHFSNCDRPYAVQTSKDASFINNNDYGPTNGTSALSPLTRNVDYNAAAIIPAAIVANTWYLNNSMKPIQVYLHCSYNTASTVSTFEIKTRYNTGTGVSIGYFTHPVGAGVGTDTLSVLLMPGEGLYVNWTAGGTGCASAAFYR